MQFVDVVGIQLRPQDGITILCNKRNHGFTCIKKKWEMAQFEYRICRRTFTWWHSQWRWTNCTVWPNESRLYMCKCGEMAQLKYRLWGRTFTWWHVHEDELTALCVEMNRSFTCPKVEKWHSLNTGFVREHSLDDMVLEDELPTARLQFHAVFWSIWWTDCHSYMKNSPRGFRTSFRINPRKTLTSDCPTSTHISTYKLE